jgi:hypothetical protein
MRLESFRRTRYLVGAVGVAAVTAISVALLTVGGARGASEPNAVLATFDVPGTYSWTVPTGVRRVIFDVYGASGGNIMGGDFVLAAGGAGGEARGTFTVKPGQTFEIVVGGRGGNASGSTGGAGGFNGGGRGSNDSSIGGSGTGGGGGGSDVRVGGIGNPCLSDLSCGFGGRFIVGGGGGGGGKFGDWVDGGAGGGLVGGPDAVRGGTQERGGDSGSPTNDGTFGDGAFGLGGSGSSGGGGGGWYGGATGSSSGAGGGSGFISHFARKGSFPGGVRGGDGLVVISTP